MRSYASALVIILLSLSTYSFAQKNELALTVGGTVSTSQQTTFVGLTCLVNVQCNGPFKSSTGTGVAFAADYTRQIFNFRAVSLGAEFPLVGAPHRDVTTVGPGLPAVVAFSQSSVFFTPSVRIKFVPSSPISPFFSIGGGLARLQVGNAVDRGALQYGGGVDFRTPLRHLAVRAEIRDFRSIGLNENSGLTLVSPAHQNNLFAGAGIVLKF
jgi:hypothetical protein